MAWEELESSPKKNKRVWTSERTLCLIFWNYLVLYCIRSCSHGQRWSTVQRTHIYKNLHVSLIELFQCHARFLLFLSMVDSNRRNYLLAVNDPLPENTSNQFYEDSSNASNTNDHGKELPHRAYIPYVPHQYISINILSSGLGYGYGGVHCATRLGSMLSSPILLWFIPLHTRGLTFLPQFFTTLEADFTAGYIHMSTMGVPSEPVSNALIYCTYVFFLWVRCAVRCGAGI